MNINVEDDASTLPERSKIVKMISDHHKRNINRAIHISIGEKRKCFLALRNYDSAIAPSLLIMPFGITVSSFAIASLLQ